MAQHSNIKCWLGSFVIFQEIQTNIAKNPRFEIFRGGGPDPLPTPSVYVHGLNSSNNIEI